MTDTLVLSRLICPDLKNDDFNQQWSDKQSAKRLHGSHSLKAWGYWLGCPQGRLRPEDTDWDDWSEEMQSYCRQDVTDHGPLSGSICSLRSGHRKPSGSSMTLPNCAIASVRPDGLSTSTKRKRFTQAVR